jgi:predicted RNase H-like HicB family nuclease
MIIPAEEGGYVAEIEYLPGCFTQGETLEETYTNIEEARRLWIEVAYEDGQDIPEPRGKQGYSGNFIVRGPKSLHRKLDQMQAGGGQFEPILVAPYHSIGFEDTEKQTHKQDNKKLK